MKQYAHNAVSAESPTFFKGNYSIVSKERPMNLGKKLITQPVFRQEVTPRKHCISLPPMNIDQDYDSIKFSHAQDVSSGVKDTIRYKSNFYKNFFEKMKNGFIKPRQEITFLNPIRKIVRESPSPMRNLKLQKSINKIIECNTDFKLPEDIDPGNRLLQAYNSETPTCKSPASTRINFSKNSQLDISTISSKINCILTSTEIKEFEKRLPKPLKHRGNIWYQEYIGK